MFKFYRLGNFYECFLQLLILNRHGKRDIKRRWLLAQWCMSASAHLQVRRAASARPSWHSRFLFLYITVFNIEVDKAIYIAQYYHWTYTKYPFINLEYKKNEIMWLFTHYNYCCYIFTFLDNKVTELFWESAWHF